MSDVKQRFERFLDPDKAAEKRVLLVGCGGIGSWLAHSLVRMGVSLSVCDFDKVEEANVGVQAFSLEDVGVHKTEALYDQFLLMDMTCGVYTERFNVDVVEGVKPHAVVLALDSLKARKECVGVLRSVQWRGRLFDPRMSLQSGEVNSMDVKWGDADFEASYVSPLDDTDAIQEPCGARSIAYTGMMAAAITSAAVAAWLREDVWPKWQAFGLHNGMNVVPTLR